MSLEDFIRKAAFVELTNVGGYLRRGKNGQMVHVQGHHRQDPMGVAKELSSNTGNLTDQQVQLSIDYLRTNFNKLNPDQQRAAEHVIEQLEAAKRTRQTAGTNLKYDINPLRTDEARLDWVQYRARLRGILQPDD